MKSRVFINISQPYIIMSIFAYIRVSTMLQSHSSQEYEIRSYCRKNHIHVDHWVSESVSGTVAVEKRTLGNLIENMSDGDMLICSELSRLGRNMLMIMGVLNQCASKGVSIHTIKDNFDLSDNINSKIIAFAFALAAEIERNLISQRTKEALAAKKQEGVKLGRPRGSSKKNEMLKCNEKEIVSLLESGCPMSSIAKKYGIHRNTLRKYLISRRIR